MAWYLTVAEAAAETGISEKRLREYVNSDDPPAVLMQGSKRLLNMEKLRGYLEEREER